MRRGFVRLGDSAPVPCYVTQDTWNGFACPTFAKEDLPALFAMLATMDMRASVVGDGVCVEFDGEEELFPFDSDGRAAVGAFFWTWSEATIDPTGAP